MLNWWRARVAPTLYDASFEVFFGVLCLLAALPMLARPTEFAPRSIQATLPLGLVIAWGITLLMGGVLVLTGLFTRNYRIEQAGLALLGSGALVFGMSIVLFAPWDPSRALSVATYGAFTLTCVYRYRQLTRVLYAIQHARELQHEEEDRSEGGS